MAKYKRMCILVSERKALADSCENGQKKTAYNALLLML